MKLFEREETANLARFGNLDNSETNLPDLNLILN